MSESQAMLELRVLSGLQAGARLTLSDGKHALGTGDECDIVLAGPGIEPQALVIVVDDVHLHLHPGQPGCGLTAGDSLSDPFMLKPGVPFHLGDIWLVVDHPTNPWPENRSWLFPMPSPHPALSAGASDAVKKAPYEVESERLRPLNGPRRPLFWLKWVSWCIAVFCLGGLGILAWFKFGIEYLPNMRAMTEVHLSRLTEISDQGAVAKPVTPRSEEPATKVPRAHQAQAQQASAPELLLLGAAPAAPSVSASPLLGLPLAGSHLVSSRIGERAEQVDKETASAADLARLPFVVRQVACGNVASITTDKGVKLFEGASHNGYELTRVSAERLRLRGPHSVELAC